MNKIVSIIIPAFNNESTIIETLESVENQTHKNHEILIVNDGSIDKTVEIVITHIKKKNLKNIILINQENSGPAAARNNGAKKATGDFLVFLDADDKLHPTYLEKALNVFSDLTVEIVYSNTEFFDAQQGLWELKSYSIQNILTNNCIPIFAMIKKDTFFKVNMFDENLKFNEDWDLWIKIIKENNNVYKIPETLFYYRKRKDSSSLSDNKDNNNSADLARLYIYNKHYTFYIENHLSLTELINNTFELKRYKKKYNSIWYKKIFRQLKK